jgi:hypothetical protein
MFTSQHTATIPDGVDQPMPLWLTVVLAVVAVVLVTGVATYLLNKLNHV